LHITYLSRRYAAPAMTPQPDLPEAAHHDLDSMLSRKFGKEVANYFAGSPLNRVSFLRTDNKFLSAAVKHSSAKFILAKELAPLSKDPQTLYLTNYAEVKPIIGEEPYGKDEKELISSYNSSKIIPQLIFLGLDERQKEDVFSWNIYSGQPYFVLDITPKGEYKEVAEKLIADKEAAGLTFMGGRSHMSLPAGMAAIYGQGRALLTGMRGTRSAVAADSRRLVSMLATSGHVLLPTGRMSRVLSVARQKRSRQRELTA